MISVLFHVNKVSVTSKTEHSWWWWWWTKLRDLHQTSISHSDYEPDKFIKSLAWEETV